MATWKKVIVSGSDISQLSNDANYLVNAQLAATLTGSFTGSFAGDGSNLTGVVAAIPNSLLLGDGLAGGTFDGQAAVTASVDTGSAYFTTGVRGKISVSDTTGAVVLT
jgi:uncharacterized membrane protein (DUF441 family)